MVVGRFLLLSLSKKVTAPEKFLSNGKKGKRALYEPEKIIRSKDGMPLDFEAALVPEKQSTESEVDSAKKSVERENSNKIEVIENNRNDENITTIVIDLILQIELFLLIFIICIHETFLSLLFLVKIKLK